LPPSDETKSRLGIVDLKVENHAAEETFGRRDCRKATPNGDLTELFWTRLCAKMVLERSLGLPKKRYSLEQIVTLLRQIEVSMAQENSTPVACRDAGISLQSCTMSC